MKVGPSNNWETVWQNKNIKVEATKKSDKDRDEAQKDKIVIDVEFEEVIEKELSLPSYFVNGACKFYNSKGKVYQVPTPIGNTLVVV